MQEETQVTPRPMTESTRSVIGQLLVAGPLSRAELSRRLSLSPASLTKITRPLIDAGYLREVQGVPASLAGRPSQPLDIDENSAHFIGIKLTGESLFAVLTNMRGAVIREHPIELPGHEVSVVVSTIAEAVESLMTERLRVSGIGISLSGNAIRSEKTVRTSPFLHWHQVPLASLVAERTGLPTTLDNDVRALTAFEHWFGAASDLDSFVLLTFGAGIGCGVVSNGSQIEGRFGASGLIGHLPIDDRGPLCYAGHRGCAHAYATIAGLTRTISAGLGVSLLSFEECVELAGQGDPVATTAFREAGRAIGQLIATVVNILGPQKVLISGEGVQMFQLGREAARERVGELLHWTTSEPDIHVQPFDFIEWARGAAVVAIQQHIGDLGAITSTAHKGDS